MIGLWVVLCLILGRPHSFLWGWQDLGPPDRLILGFAPELIGGPLPDDAVSATEVVKKEGHTYYQWCATFPRGKFMKIA